MVSLRGLACLVAVLSLFRPALAQNTGSLAGRVSDAVTGKSLQGAVVRVPGTSAVSHTDAEGRFNLPRVPAGPQRIEVDYVGLDSHVKDVSISAGGVTTFNAQLQSDTLRKEAFTVAESARGQALAINQQKTAAGIVNIVSEETFGQMLISTTTRSATATRRLIRRCRTTSTYNSNTTPPKAVSTRSAYSTRK